MFFLSLKLRSALDNANLDVYALWKCYAWLGELWRKLNCILYFTELFLHCVIIFIWKYEVLLHLGETSNISYSNWSLDSLH